MEEQIGFDNTYEGPTSNPKEFQGWQSYFAKLKEVCEKC